VYISIGRIRYPRSTFPNIPHKRRSPAGKIGAAYLLGENPDARLQFSLIFIAKANFTEIIGDLLFSPTSDFDAKFCGAASPVLLSGKESFKINRRVIPLPKFLSHNRRVDQRFIFSGMISCLLELGSWLLKIKLVSNDSPNPQAAAARLKKVSPLRPTLAIVLGSGFHHVLNELRVDKKVSYAKIPGFQTQCERTRGRTVFGRLAKRR